MLIYAFDSGLATLAQIHSGGKIASTQEEFQAGISNGDPGILIMEKGVKLSFKLMDDISASLSVVILGLSGTQKPSGIPLDQFKTFEPNTFLSTLRSLTNNK